MKLKEFTIDVVGTAGAESKVGYIRFECRNPMSDVAPTGFCGCVHLEDRVESLKYLRDALSNMIRQKEISAKRKLK